MKTCANLGADDIGICDRIKQLRIDHGEKQETVAKVLGVARTTYSKLENGTNKFNIDMIVRLADHFGVDCDYILRGYLSEHRDTCQLTGLSEKAIEHLMVYRLSPDQKSLKTLNLLLESVGFAGFLAWVSRYISECNEKDPTIETWVKPDLETYRYILEKNGFVVTTHSEAARNCYETALEELKKALDKIVEQTGGEHNGQHP